ncbi:GNAT family N-acetyltransferase [Gemmatimonas sp.]|uniref:GNAT family N-acetyltransferase n=1 Tax=Gemmatimonas sp. TaxID=1962908 RepID=UPI0027B892F9|nr:GNAT family N-acetyltransferase [Gemmatimonas sp.]
MTRCDWQPTIRGALVLLEPLQAGDFEALYAVASDPLIWEQHPEHTRWQREVFTGFFQGAMQSGSALLIRDAVTGDVIGSSRFYEWDANAGEVAIGYTFLARSHWGGGVNGELKRLMLDHAMRYAQRVWFHVGTANHRSRRALAKIGAVFSHSCSADATRGGRDVAYYVVHRA